VNHTSEPRISVIIPTCERRTLRRAVRSSRWADEIVVVFDAAAPPARPPRDCVVRAVGPSHDWGATQRNLAMSVAGGTHFAFMDDDDVYTRRAGRVIRAAVIAQPDRVHIFSMRNADAIASGPIASGSIGTPMFVVPREPVGTWTPRYGHDLDFIAETMALRGDDPVYHPEVVAIVRAPTLARAVRALVRPRTQARVLGRWLRGARRRLRPGA
jgi:hypothetical protein